MLAYFIIALAGISGNDAAFKNEHVDIDVTIASNVYTYQVRNLSTEPLVGFEIRQYAAYNFITPDDWQQECTSDMFRAWTQAPETGIAPGDTGKFSLRVSSRGAILGSVPVIVSFDSGTTSTVAAVWSPVKEPSSYIALVVVVFLVIILLHSVIIIRKNRSGKAHPISDA